MVVARTCDGETEKILIVVDSLDDCHQKEHELTVFGGRGAGIEEIEPRIRAHRPVVVLARAVDALEGLLVQQADEAVAGSDLLHHLHRELVLIGRNVDGRENGRELVLCGGDFVVLGLGEDPVPPEFFVELLHECRHTRLDGTEVVILEFLALGRLGAKQRAARKDEVLTLLIHALVDEEVLLFRAHLRDDALRRRVAEETQNAHRLTVEGLHALQKRSLLVEHFAAVREKRRGDIEGAVLDECKGRGIPCSIAAGLEGGAHAARRERGCIGLPHHELLARELHDDLAVLGGRDEAVMLLRRDARHGLEPVREVRRALLQRPVLHRVGDNVGDVHVERVPEANGLDERLVRLLGQSFLHDLTVEHIGCKDLGNTHTTYLQVLGKQKDAAPLRPVRGESSQRLCCLHLFDSAIIIS